MKYNIEKGRKHKPKPKRANGLDLVWGGATFLFGGLTPMPKDTINQDR